MRSSFVDPWYALADPTRRRVYARVVERPATATAIAGELPVSRPAVSQHLQVLLAARLVVVQRSGRENVYRPRQEGLDQLRRELEGFWSQTLASFKLLAEQTYSSGSERTGSS